MLQHLLSPKPLPLARRSSETLRWTTEALHSAPKSSVNNNFAKEITGTDADVLRRDVLFLHFILVLECMMTTIELCSGLTAIYNNESHINTKITTRQHFTARCGSAQPRGATNLLHHRLRWPVKCYNSDVATAHNKLQCLKASLFDLLKVVSIGYKKLWRTFGSES